MITIRRSKLDVGDMYNLIFRALPAQGCVEVQRDAPGKKHTLHEHKVDETIVVIDGSLKFYWEHGERVCSSGDVISLPGGSPHGSEALENGATYLIAFHNVAI